MSYFKRNPAVILLAVSIISPVVSNAATLPVTCNDFIGLFNRVAYTFAAFIFMISIIMVLIAAFTFVSAAGNAEKATKARGTLVFAVIGIAVALLAFSVPAIIVSFFGGSVLTNCA